MNNKLVAGSWWLVAIPLVVQACAVGPNPRPRTEPVRAAAGAGGVPAAARPFYDSLSAVGQMARPAPIMLDTTAGAQWWSVLRDSQLVLLVQAALRNNRDLQAAVARVREYRALYGVARGELLPSLTGNASAGRSKQTFGSLSFPASSAFRLTADVAWELDFWGRIRRNTQAANFDLSGREDDQRAVLLSLVSDVATAYLELRELDADVRIAEQTLGTRQQVLGLARQRFAQGVISELDSRQFEAEVAAAAARLAQFSRQRAQKENQLSVLIGATPAPIPRGGAFDSIVRSVTVPDSVSSVLIIQRPDVRRAQDDWSAALARVGAAQAARLPRFAITSNYGRQATHLDSLFQSRSEVWSLQAGVSVPLFTGGRVEAQASAARARAEQARARYEQTVLTAFRETGDALTGVRLGRDELAAQETSVRALRRALELAQRRYESGVSSYFEVLDVQRNLFNAELVLIQVQRQYLASTVQLYRALGGTWTDSR